MKERLRQWGLLDRTIPPDERCEHDYTVVGILPMLWEWVAGVWTYTWVDFDATMLVIRSDHPKVDRFFGYLGWSVTP